MSDGADLPAKAEQPVGYGQPPAEHRFKQGRSGNPKGRPRKAKSAVAKAVGQRLVGSNEPTTMLILEEAYRLVKVRDGENIIEMPVNQAVLRSMLQNALKGSRLAQRDFTMLLRTIETEQKEAQLSYFQAMATYKWDGEAEIARCKRLGIQPPEMVPHPDDIVIDARHGTALMCGPFTPDEKKQLQKSINRRDEAASIVAEAAAKHRRLRNSSTKRMWFEEWQFEQRIFDIINDALPERYRTKLEDRSYAEGFSRAGDHKIS